MRNGEQIVFGLTRKIKPLKTVLTKSSVMIEATPISSTLSEVRVKNISFTNIVIVYLGRCNCYFALNVICRQTANFKTSI